MLESLKSKVIASVLIVSISGLFGITYYLSNTLYDLSDKTAKNTLEMLSKSIFQTLTGSMLVGDPAVVQDALRDARAIEGIERLDVSNQNILCFELKKKSRLHSWFSAKTLHIIPQIRLSVK